MSRSRVYSILHTVIFWAVAFLALFILASLVGCSTVKPDYSGLEWEHISHPAAGPPFGPVTEEDSLDHLNGYVGYHIGKRGYVEITTGYRLSDGGFYGPDWTGGIRAGIKIHGER